jgi:hypothetical protein
MLRAMFIFLSGSVGLFMSPIAEIIGRGNISAGRAVANEATAIRQVFHIPQLARDRRD